MGLPIKTKHSKFKNYIMNLVYEILVGFTKEKDVLLKEAE